MSTPDQIIESARYVYASDDVQIDDFAEVITTDTGHWVQAWVYITNEENAE